MTNVSSINPYYTFHYTQPEEYRFSHDSVFLARKVFELHTEDLTHLSALDLCSGCGIVGLDFLFHCRATGRPMPAGFDFVEVQKIYETYFEENKRAFGEGLPGVRFLNQNYESLKTAKYDLILSNPPYFRQDQGTLSASEFKNRCRFFIDSGFSELLRSIEAALTPDGAAYVLLRGLGAHGIDSLQEARVILKSFCVEVVADIRGTDLVKIKRTR